MPRLLENLKIREVSSVRRGAGKGVKIMLMKMAGSTAPAPSSTPTGNETLDKAILRMFEVSSEHGVPPENLAKARKALSASIAEVEKNVAAEKQQEAVEKSLSQCVEYLTGLVPFDKADSFLAAVAAFPAQKETAMKPEELQKLLDDAVKKAMGPIQKSLDDALSTVAKQGEQLAIVGMTKDHQDYVAWLKDKAGQGETAEAVKETVDAFIKADEAQRAKIIKAFPPKKKVPPKEDDQNDLDKQLATAVADALENSPVLAKLREDNTRMAKQLGETTDAAAVAVFAKRAKDLGLPESHGEVMRKAYAGDADAIKKNDEFMKGLVEQARTGVLFKEFGGGGGDGTGATAYELIKQKADELRKTEHGAKLSPQQARSRIISDPMNKELVDRHRAEETARRRAA